MEELDKKLDDILDAFGPQDDRYGVYTEEVREKIKQAFIDAGWKHDGSTDAVEHVLAFYKKRAEGVDPIWVRIAGTEFMTGQEWYDRMKGELDDLLHFHGYSSETVLLGKEEVYKAVQRASRLEK